MEHPKSYYKLTSEGIIESLAMTPEEGQKMVQEGWHVHPQDARYAGVEIVECGSEEPAPRKPGRPRK